MMTANSVSGTNAPPLGRYLASTEKKIRDKAIKNLAAFLGDPDHDLPKSEINKLWKGIFYCFWMSDKPLVQQALADELAELVLAIQDTQKSLDFLRGFWTTTVREWNGIDRLRIDKYYLLIRRFVNASFRLLIRTDFDEDTCQEYIDILTGTGGPLCPSDTKVPAGLAYHLSDLYLEEFDKSLAKTPSTSASTSITIPAQALQNVLEPFIRLAAQTPNSLTYKRMEDYLFHPLFKSVLPDSSAPHAENSDESDEEADSRSRKRARTDGYPHLSDRLENPQQVRSVLAKHLFEVASRESTRDSSRRKLYKFWRTLGEDTEE
jgi:ribosomal RNA-processing protein 1